MYDFTNYGACVDTMAPGVDIWSSQTSHLTKPAGAQDVYSVKSGTSMATPLVAGTTALFLEALGAGASALDAQYAMLHANKPSVVAPSLSQKNYAVPACPTNAAIVQAPRAVEEGYNTSVADPTAACQLAKPRLSHINPGLSPDGRYDVGPTPKPVNTTYSFILFNADPRFKVCLSLSYPPGNATAFGNTAAVAAGESIEVGVPTKDFSFVYFSLPNDSNATCAEATEIPTKLVWYRGSGTPGTIIGWVEPNPESRGPFRIAADSGGKSYFQQGATGVGKCAIFIHHKWNTGDVINYGKSWANAIPQPSYFHERERLSGAFQLVLTCTNGADSWTTTKDFCPEWFCPAASMVYVPYYSEAGGLQLLPHVLKGRGRAAPRGRG